ncbi:glycosyltransferase family 4 protein [Marinobacter bryozoorum]|uniref:glycosyltransferase family 4 protein n=1 Tax=Marinobacter bryozoorum TaxID=256324 RepID=UPI00200417DE|nr:glycosyltransferase family 4 protein [Marinobacter bryozoorum]MCK7544305.1 glycosyltransferase family 4 protein [Marinobacter bryozoorum]
MTAPQSATKHSKQRIAVVGNLTETMLGFRGELIRDMVAAGHEVFAFAPDYDDQSRKAVRALGAHPVSYPIRQLGTNPLADLYTLWRLYRLFRKHRITMTFCYFIKPSIYGTLAAWLAGVPRRVVKIEGLGRMFTHTPGKDPLKQRLTRAIMVNLFRLSLPRAHKVFVLNRGDCADLLRFGIPKPEILGGIGVCLERYHFHAPVADPVQFIFAGRLLTEKGIHYFLEAAKNLQVRYTNARFLVVGGLDTKPGSVTRRQLNQLQKQGVIHYAGPVPDIVPWLGKSSVFVLPTYYREGVPRSTQEALAMARPVITTNMPGCRKTVNNGINGYLVEPHNQQALEAAMTRFLEHPELIKTMGEASHQLAVERFDVRKINQHILTQLNLQPPTAAEIIPLAPRQTTRLPTQEQRPNTQR